MAQTTIKYDELYTTALGNGLFRVGRDIECTYPLISFQGPIDFTSDTPEPGTSGTTPFYKKQKVIYHYENYDIIVEWYWHSDTKTKTYVSWNRDYGSNQEPADPYAQ